MGSRKVAISEARRQLFALFDQVTANGDRVVIERRGREGRAVLINAEYLLQLEARQNGKPGKYAPVTGTMLWKGDPGKILDDIRARQKKLERAKQRRLWASLQT